MGRGMFIQHAGCEGWLDDESQPHSVDFPAPFFNLTMFNIGYHSVHHDLPGLHWSELPQAAELNRVSTTADPPQSSAP